MHTAHFSGHISCHAYPPCHAPPFAMHVPHYTSPHHVCPPLPCMPPFVTHAPFHHARPLHHTYPPFTMHTPMWTDRYLWKHKLCKLLLRAVMIWDLMVHAYWLRVTQRPTLTPSKRNRSSEKWRSVSVSVLVHCMRTLLYNIIVSKGTRLWGKSVEMEDPFTLTDTDIKHIVLNWYETLLTQIFRAARRVQRIVLLLVRGRGWGGRAWGSHPGRFTPWCPGTTRGWRRRTPGRACRGTVLWYWPCGWRWRASVAAKLRRRGCPSWSAIFWSRSTWGTRKLLRWACRRRGWASWWGWWAPRWASWWTTAIFRCGRPASGRRWSTVFRSGWRWSTTRSTEFWTTTRRVRASKVMS